MLFADHVTATIHGPPIPFLFASNFPANLVFFAFSNGTTSLPGTKGFTVSGLPWFFLSPRFSILGRFGQVQLYNIVSDVASYPRFLPFCSASRITKPPTENQPGSGVHVMEAELTVGFPPFEESYVSKVTCIPSTSVMVC